MRATREHEERRRSGRETERRCSGAFIPITHRARAGRPREISLTSAGPPSLRGGICATLGPNRNRSRPGQSTRFAACLASIRIVAIIAIMRSMRSLWHISINMFSSPLSIAYAMNMLTRSCTKLVLWRTL